MAETIKKMAVVEMGLLMNMARSPQHVATFPFLAQLQDVMKGTEAGKCQSCGAAAKARMGAINSVKAAMASMSPEQVQAMKTLLNTQKIRVRYTNGARSVVKDL